MYTNNRYLDHALLCGYCSHSYSKRSKVIVDFVVFEVPTKIICYCAYNNCDQIWGNRPFSAQQVKCILLLHIIELSPISVISVMIRPLYLKLTTYLISHASTTNYARVTST